MTRDDIIRMAREAQWLGNIEGWTFNSYDELERFFRLAHEAGAAAERERIIAANAPEIERINAHIKELEQARLEEREACARVCDAVAESANKAAVAGQYLIVRNGAEARRCSAAIRAQGQRTLQHCAVAEQARQEGRALFLNPAAAYPAAIRAQAADRLARHGIQIPEDDHDGNPSFG